MAAMVGSVDRPGIEPQPPASAGSPIVMYLRVETHFSVAVQGPLEYSTSVSSVVLIFGVWLWLEVLSLR